jgi:X-X-X-Leu-X-X-Gly heptad repeat protein
VREGKGGWGWSGRSGTVGDGTVTVTDGTVTVTDGTVTVTDGYTSVQGSEKSLYLHLN